MQYLYKCLTKLIAIMLCTIFFLACTGCGQKGPLYLPEEDDTNHVENGSNANIPETKQVN